MTQTSWHPLNATEVYIEIEKTCSLPESLYYTDPISGKLHMHDIMTLIGGIFTIISFVCGLGNAYWHLSNFTVPREQRQIVRIVLAPFFFSVFYFFALWFYGTQNYLTVVAELYELFSLVAIFLLFHAYMIPDHSNYEEFFDKLQYRTTHRKKHQKFFERGSLVWYYALSFGTLQILPVRLTTSIAFWTVHATECPLTEALTHQDLVIQIVDSIMLTVCVTCIIEFYSGLRSELKPRHAMAKLTVFKGMVGIALFQPLIFTILIENGILSPSDHMSALDWFWGLPSFLTCIEMGIFSIFFFITFSAKEYSVKNGYRGANRPMQEEGFSGERRNRMSFGAALLHVLNIWDIVERAFTVLTFIAWFRYKKERKYYDANEEMESLK